MIIIFLQEDHIFENIIVHKKNQFLFIFLFFLIKLFKSCFFIFIDKYEYVNFKVLFNFLFCSGAVVLVSHDDDFVEQVGITHEIDLGLELRN